MKSGHKRAGALAAAVLAVGLSACTSDSDDNAAAATPEASTEATATPTPIPTTVVTPTPYTGPANVGSTPLPAVGVGEPVDIEGAVSVSVTSVDDIDIEATSPGDIPGPAIAVVVEFDNAGDEVLDLGGVAVNASYDGVPASQSASVPTDLLKGELAPGESADGTYVFKKPEDPQDPLVIEVEHNQSQYVITVRR